LTSSSSAISSASFGGVSSTFCVFSILTIGTQTQKVEDTPPKEAELIAREEDVKPKAEDSPKEKKANPISDLQSNREEVIAPLNVADPIKIEVPLKADTSIKVEINSSATLSSSDESIDKENTQTNTPVIIVSDDKKESKLKKEASKDNIPNGNVSEDGKSKPKFGGTYNKSAPGSRRGSSEPQGDGPRRQSKIAAMIGGFERGEQPAKQMTGSRGRFPR
jgi:hypothetical protein